MSETVVDFEHVDTAGDEFAVGGSDRPLDPRLAAANHRRREPGGCRIVVWPHLAMLDAPSSMSESVSPSGRGAATMSHPCSRDEADGVLADLVEQCGTPAPGLTALGVTHAFPTAA